MLCWYILLLCTVVFYLAIYGGCFLLLHLLLLFTVALLENSALLLWTVALHSCFTLFLFPVASHCCHIRIVAVHCSFTLLRFTVAKSRCYSLWLYLLFRCHKMLPNTFATSYCYILFFAWLFFHVATFHCWIRLLHTVASSCCFVLLLQTVGLYFCDLPPLHPLLLSLFTWCCFLLLPYSVAHYAGLRPTPLPGIVGKYCCFLLVLLTVVNYGCYVLLPGTITKFCWQKTAPIYCSLLLKICCCLLLFFDFCFTVIHQFVLLPFTVAVVCRKILLFYTFA